MLTGDGPAPLPRGWFFKGLKTQGNVIGALLMRELHTRYGRDNIGYLWMVVEPMMLATSVGLLHAGSTSHYGSDIMPVPFAIIGYCCFIIFRNIFNRAEGTLEANMPLLYHRMVTLFDMLFARALLEGAGVGLTLFIMIGLATSVGYASLPMRPVWLIAAILFLTWWSFGASMIICAATYKSRLVARLVHPASYILMPLSGAFYQLEWLPEPYQTWMSWFPMTQMFEMARYGQFEFASEEHFDLVYIAGWCCCLTIAGMLATKVVRQHVHLN